MNVWSWMEDVTPTALTQKAAMNVAAVTAMLWCQMSGHVQVGFNILKVPPLYISANMNMVFFQPNHRRVSELQNYYLLLGWFVCCFFFFPRYWWMWKQSRYLWWWAMYQYSRGISLSLLWWVYGFYGHEDLYWWVAVCTKFNRSLNILQLMF